MAELAAREARLNAQADALAAQQQVRDKVKAFIKAFMQPSDAWAEMAGCYSGACYP
jgi:hypothetical protein